ALSRRVMRESWVVAQGGRTMPEKVIEGAVAGRARRQRQRRQGRRRVVAQHIGAEEEAAVFMLRSCQPVAGSAIVKFDGRQGRRLRFGRRASDGRKAAVRIAQRVEAT